MHLLDVSTGQVHKILVQLFRQPVPDTLMELELVLALIVQVYRTHLETHVMGLQEQQYAQLKLQVARHSLLQGQPQLISRLSVVERRIAT